jgi:hypothetical protein
VAFTLKGLNEPLEGDGAFTMEPFEVEDPDAPPAPKKGALTRLLEALFRFLFRLRHGRAARGAHADAGPGEGMVKLTFRLRVDPGGPQAPMINAMMKPAMLAAAEDLSNRIVTHLERKQTGPE